MAKKFKTGDSVEIKDGSVMFDGHTGRVLYSEGDGKYNTMYRVKLDEVVMVPGVGRIESDLWSGEFLKKVRT